MKRALALVLCASLSCAPAVKHPAYTSAVLGFLVGFGTCEVDEVGAGTCALVGGGAAAVLGGVAALVLAFTTAGDPVTEGEIIENPAPLRKLKHYTDAGVDAAPVDPIDAGVPDAPVSDR